jgi:CubicO group peptidase (beta-lactamase class C family)
VQADPMDRELQRSLGMRKLWLVLVPAAGCVGTAPGGPGSEPNPSVDGGIDGQPVQVDCDAIFDRPGLGQTFYEDNPTYIDERELPEWIVSTPGDVGIDGEALEVGAAELAQSPALLSLLVVRDGALVFERYYHGSDASHSNNIHSASKSILTTLLGIALADGTIASLDAPLANYLPDYIAAGSDKAAITLRHVATMSSGLEWTEDDTEYSIESSDDWVGAILEQPMTGTPGDFNYSSGMSHVLSAVLTRATGTSTCTYAHDKLLGPLGITAEHWGRDPSGVFSGGYNLYMTARELARFGLLFLRDGEWEGRQLVPRSWVQEAIQPQLPAEDGYDYGYYWWLLGGSPEDVAIAWGFGGQFVYLVPSLDLMVVMTADTASDHEELDGETFLYDHLLPAVQ